MYRLILLVALLSSTCAGFAQQSTTDTGAAASGEPNMTRLFENVNAIAEELKASLADLESNIEDSRNSMEKGGEVLDAMLASVNSVHGSMAEESEIWTELTSLLDLWEERRKTALEKSESNPEFAKIADEWQGKISVAKDLRNQISTERANSLALIRAIESDREIVLAYYELGQADKAIEGLQKVGASLANLNESMQQIVQTASTVEQPISN